MANNKKVSNYILRSKLSMLLDISTSDHIDGLGMRLNTKMLFRLYYKLYDNLDTNIGDSISGQTSSEVFDYHS